jgi:hypothetical protein
VKVRTAEQLFDLITEDSAWRKRELTVFRRGVETSNPSTQPALLRASVALLYAHWEGFIKNSCYWYLCFLAAKRLSVQQLRPELAAMALRTHMATMIDTSRPLLYAEVVRHIRERASERARIPTSRDAIRTASNLSSVVLRDVLSSVGCDAERYDYAKDLIDDQLVASRNRIAHGEADYVRLSEWNELREEVIKIMDDVASQIVNAAIEETFYAWKA